MEKSKRFWENLAEKYAKQPIGDEQAYQYGLDRTRAYLKPTDKVIEIGCGTGSTAVLLCDSVADYTANDFAENMIRIGKEKAASAGKTNLKFVLDNAESPALGTEAYDAVLAYNVLPLVEDIPTVLKRVHKMLKPGGTFISKSFCAPAHPWPAQLYLMGVMLPILQIFNKAPKLQLKRVEEMDALVRDAGFKIVETGNYPASPPRRFIVAKKA